MEFTKLKFMTKRTQIKWLGASSNPAEDDFDEHDVKRVAAPHPDLFNKADDLIPHLLADAGISQGTYRVTEVDFNSNEDGESITVKAKKMLKGSPRSQN